MPRRFLAAIVVGVIAAACGASGGTGQDGLDQTGVHAAAIEYAKGVTQLSQKDLVYVAGPALEQWDQWCGFDPGLSACEVLETTSFDLPAMYKRGREPATEIEKAFAPAEVSFIEDPQSVIEPFEEGMMLAPVKDDAGLVTFGVPIEADGKIYLPADGHGNGWLFEATPSDSATGWDISVIAEFVV